MTDMGMSPSADTVARYMFIVLGGLLPLAFLLTVGLWLNHKCVAEKPTAFCYGKKLNSHPGFRHTKE
jgi:hypothetical protein